jgi:23S rRNA (uracil1939-C5)-methyltransferase
MAEIYKNKTYTMTIDDIGTQGEGIGKIDGFTVFVENALPHEEIEVLIVKLKKSYGYGKLLNVIKASPLRCEPFCPVAKQCGGCSLQHLSYEGQLMFKTNKVKQNIARIGGFDDIEVENTLGMEHPYNYRNKAQYPVNEENGKINIGFYAARSHRIINIDNCGIGNKADGKILALLRDFMEKYNVTAYNEENGTGTVRHILIRNAYHTGELMICLVVNTENFKLKKEFEEHFKTLENLTCLALSYNTKKTNVIMGDKIEIVYGKGYITDCIGDLKFQISPLTFFQVNPLQTEVLYKKALEFADLTGNETVFDAYCGAGTISLFLAQKAKKVYGVEIVAPAIENAKENAKLNNITNAEFFVGKSEEVIPNLYKNGITADVMVVDPPRKGCDTKLLDMLLDMSPQKIVYVSCDSATLARDLKHLCQTGKYQIKKVQPVDMFPFGGHVETVVLMSRIDK